MVVLSRYPIDHDRVRTFQMFRWADMPGRCSPTTRRPPRPADWYSAEILEVFRLSSKSHWDVPVRVGRKTVHVLASHPTPPTFDGPEDRNGTRNHDEIRFWADYVTPGAGRYIYDDAGRRGGLRPGRGSSSWATRTPTRWTGTRWTRRSTSCWTHGGSAIRSPPRPARWRRRNCRAAPTWPTGATPRTTPPTSTTTRRPATCGPSYVLPSRWGLKVTDSGVFWPVRSDPLSRLSGEFQFPTSDHRLVWVDLRLR